MVKVFKRSQLVWAVSVLSAGTVIFLGGLSGHENAVLREIVVKEASKEGKAMPQSGWKKLYSIDVTGKPISGSKESLIAALRRGADLRIGTRFNYGAEYGLVEEGIDLRATWTLGDDQAAGITTLRHPADAGLHFGLRPRINYWLFNSDGYVAVAMLSLDGKPIEESDSSSGLVSSRRGLVSWQNDVWAHERSKHSGEHPWFLRDDWEEIYAHSAEGEPLKGSWEAVALANRSGRALKVGVSELCADLVREGEKPIPHEVFIELGTVFTHVDHKYVAGITHPLMLVRPAIPLGYGEGEFAPCWLLVRTDGKVHRQILTPETLTFKQSWRRYKMRWFAR